MALEDKLGSDGDKAYAALMQAHEGLTSEESHQLNARLILLMMNQIGEFVTILDLLETARNTD